MQKIKDTFFKVYNYVDTYSNFYFRFVSKNPKTSTAIWAGSTYLIWRLIPGVGF